QSLLCDLLAVEFDRPAGRPGCAKVRTEARGRNAVWQGAHHQAIAWCTRTRVMCSQRVHPAQQWPEIGLHRAPALADRIDCGAATKVQSELILSGCRWIGPGN